MTSIPSSERETLFDLPFATARERMASLRASAAPGRDDRSDASSTGGWLRRLRVRPRSPAHRPRQGPAGRWLGQDTDRPPLTTDRSGWRRTSMSRSGSAGSTTRSA